MGAQEPRPCGSRFLKIQPTRVDISRAKPTRIFKTNPKWRFSPLFGFKLHRLIFHG